MRENPLLLSVQGPSFGGVRPRSLQFLLEHNLRSPFVVRGELHVREHPAHEGLAEAAFLAGASIRLRGGLFLRDAHAVMPDDEADEGG